MELEVVEGVIVLPMRWVGTLPVSLEVLLGLKTAKIGAGCWNGPGGGIERGETPRQAAIRELAEEFNLEVLYRNLEDVAEIYFHNNPEGKPPFIYHAYVFFAWQCRGALFAHPSQNIVQPTWFPARELPEPLMLADKYWLPRVLRGERIEAAFHYGPEQKELLFPPGYDHDTAVRRVGLISSLDSPRY